jgi:hypothetical protein
MKSDCQCQTISFVSGSGLALLCLEYSFSLESLRLCTSNVSGHLRYSRWCSFGAPFLLYMGWLYDRGRIRHPKCLSSTRERSDCGTALLLGTFQPSSPIVIIIITFCEKWWPRADCGDFLLALPSEYGPGYHSGNPKLRAYTHK